MTTTTTTEPTVVRIPSGADACDARHWSGQGTDVATGSGAGSDAATGTGAGADVVTGTGAGSDAATGTGAGADVVTGASGDASATGSFAGPRGRPCVVMAHGLGATRDGGLDGFAERLAAEGLDVLAFDYRGFADSGGGPRQDVDPARQREDYRSAIAHARTIPGVDPDRIVVWGCSFAGGHVLRVAAEDPRVAAVVSLTPAGDGMAVMRKLLAEDGVGAALRLTALGIRDLLAAIRGRDPVTAPLVARPGEVAAITAPGALERYTALAGPSWRNVVAGRIFLRIGAYRPIRKAAAIDGALLVQVADEDTVAPPAAQTAAGVRGRAQVHHYPCDHFDVYPGQPWFDAIVEHQIAFLRRALAVA